MEDFIPHIVLYRFYRGSRDCSAEQLLIRHCLIVAKEDGIADANFIKEFEDLYEKCCSERETEDYDNYYLPNKDDFYYYFEDFQTLVSTNLTDFTRLHDYLRDNLFNNRYVTILNDNWVSLISSDHVVLEMKKSAAITQSAVLGGIFNCIPGAGHEYDEIPVNVSSHFLKKVISFCNKKNKFSIIIQSTVEQLKNNLERLIGTVDDYKAWLNKFVKSNKPYFSYLHQAADYLHIPALLELTSMGLGDMKDNSVQEISDWYEGVSIPSMLSPLGEQAYSLLSHLHFFS